MVTKVVIFPGLYTVFKMQKCNIRMLDHCQKFIAVWDGSSGGTKNCLDYANSKNDVSVDVINPEGAME